MTRKLWTVAALVLAFTASTAQQEERSLIFIVDASNSMWGQIEGRSKIELAREALIEHIAQLPDLPPEKRTPQETRIMGQGGDRWDGGNSAGSSSWRRSGW